MIKFALLFVLVIVHICEAQRDIPGDYPQASREIIKPYDLTYLGPDELSIMRNEIFARYGYIFKNPDLRDHFTATDWYKPSFADVTSKLTEIEKANIKLIVARETWYRPVPVKKLPLMRLPLNLEEVSSNGFAEVIGIQPHATNDKVPKALIGLLQDTSSYYGVLWYADGPLSVPESTPRLYFVTTYNKNLKEIATAVVSLPVGGIFELATDCSNTNIHHASFINQDLSYSSDYTWDAKCPGESEIEKNDYGVAGVINKDGAIVVRRNKQF